MSAVTKTERDFTIVRHLDAPRELVFRAWTDPDHLHWFTGAEPGEQPTTVDLRVGGAWRFHMVENAERSYVTGGIYREIVPPERLVFVFGAVDGWPPLDPTDVGDNPIVTITLNEDDGGTEMVFHCGFPDGTSDERIQEWFALGIFGGWSETVARLDEAALTAVA